MDFDNLQSQSDTQDIESAKKAIEAVRKNMVFNKATTAHKMCAKTDHACVCTERQAKSKELTRKAIEKICCNFSDTKILETCEICGKKHESLCSGNIELEVRKEVSTDVTETNGQSEANLTTLKGVSIITATCECCGKEDIEVNHLVRLDSGQLLCPDCIATFRKTASNKSD